MYYSDNIFTPYILRNFGVYEKTKNYAAQDVYFPGSLNAARDKTGIMPPQKIVIISYHPLQLSRISLY